MWLMQVLPMIFSSVQFSFVLSCLVLFLMEMVEEAEKNHCKEAQAWERMRAHMLSLVI